MEIRAEATLFPEKEYINGIAIAVWRTQKIKRTFKNIYVGEVKIHKYVWKKDIT